jgi:MFS family permease
MNLEQTILRIASEAVLVLPIVIGLTEVVKRTELIGHRFTPLVSIVFGLIIASIVHGVSVLAILAGLIYGLSASGLYSGTKTLASETTPPDDEPTQPGDPTAPATA